MLKPNRKLKIGVLMGEDFLPPSEPCRRAVLEAKDHLESLGYAVEEFDFPVRGLIKQYLRLMSADGGVSVLRLLEDDVDCFLTTRASSVTRLKSLCWRPYYVLFGFLNLFIRLPVGRSTQAAL